MGLVVAVAVIVVVVGLIRSRRLQERHALIWLCGAIVIVVLGLSTGALDALSSALGIAYPPSALFLVVVAFLGLALLDTTIAVSRLTTRLRTLAQRLAILDEEVKRLKAEREDRDLADELAVAAIDEQDGALSQGPTAD